MRTRSSLARLERRAERALGNRELCSCQRPLLVTRYEATGIQDPPEPVDPRCAACGRERQRIILNIAYTAPLRRVDPPEQGRATFPQ